jgi:hypothetical protein
MSSGALDRVVRTETMHATLAAVDALTQLQSGISGCSTSHQSRVR